MALAPGIVMALEVPVGNKQGEHRHWSDTACWREASAGESTLAGQALLQHGQGWGCAGPLVGPLRPLPAWQQH